MTYFLRTPLYVAQKTCHYGRRMLDRIQTLIGEHHDLQKQLTDAAVASNPSDLKRIKLREALPRVMQKPHIYRRDIISQPVFDCLQILAVARRVRCLRDLTHAHLHPQSGRKVLSSQVIGSLVSLLMNVLYSCDGNVNK